MRLWQISILLALLVLVGSQSSSSTVLSGTEEKNNPVLTERDNLTPLTFPLNYMQYLGVLAVFLMVIVANAGGLGGGGTMIPLIMIFFNIPIKECVPIVNFFGWLAAMLRFVLNFKQKHPRRPKRLVIDYEIISLTMPILYLGTLFGVKIGTVLSDL